jgi:hypothetical protein
VPKRHFHFPQSHLYCGVVLENPPNVGAQFPAIALRDMFENFFYLGGKMNAKTIVAFVLIHGLLAGCATDLGADRYEPVCARQCLDVHARCIEGVHQFWRGACNDNARQCLATCPAR